MNHLDVLFSLALGWKIYGRLSMSSLESQQSIECIQERTTLAETRTCACIIAVQHFLRLFVQFTYIAQEIKGFVVNKDVEKGRCVEESSTHNNEVVEITTR